MADFDMSRVELERLREVCRLIDECEALRTSVEAEGTTVKCSTGQTRVHPGLGELRQHRLALGKLLAQLDLPAENGAQLRTPLQARGVTGARARWAANPTVGRARG